MCKMHPFFDVQFWGKKERLLHEKVRHTCFIGRVTSAPGRTGCSTYSSPSLSAHSGQCITTICGSNQNSASLPRLPWTPHALLWETRLRTKHKTTVLFPADLLLLQYITITDMYICNVQVCVCGLWMHENVEFFKDKIQTNRIQVSTSWN